MAEIVSAFLVPHVPLIASNADAPPLAQREKIMSAFEHVAERLRALQVDTVINIGSDHYCLFGPSCLPSALIGIGDVEGPIEPWLGIPRAPLPTNSALARHILQTGFEDGIDWASAKNMCVDHATMIPYHYSVAPAGKIAVVPVYLNTAVDPIIPSHRAFAIGKSIGDAVRSWNGSERVAVIGTGGISHWVGMAQMGQINLNFDQQVIRWATEGNVQALIGLKDDATLAAAGNGALEIKNFICAMAAFPESKAELIAYEPVYEWIAGCGFLEFFKDAA